MRKASFFAAMLLGILFTINVYIGFDTIYDGGNGAFSLAAGALCLFMGIMSLVAAFKSDA